MLQCGRARSSAESHVGGPTGTAEQDASMWPRSIESGIAVAVSARGRASAGFNVAALDRARNRARGPADRARATALQCGRARSSAESRSKAEGWWDYQKLQCGRARSSAESFEPGAGRRRPQLGFNVAALDRARNLGSTVGYNGARAMLQCGRARSSAES